MAALKILILGATGAAGGSLFDCALASDLIAEVRTLSRRPISVRSPKHVAYLHEDLLDYAPVGAAFTGIDACFFCVGRAVAQVGDEAKYRVLVFDYALAAARELRTRSPEAVFHYLSGGGASPTSRQMWARVKAEAEQALLAEYGAVCWRPGAIDATRTEGWPWFYKIVIPTMRYLAPSRRFYVRGESLAQAMLQVASNHDRRRIIENPEIRTIAERVTS